MIEECPIKECDSARFQNFDCGEPALNEYLSCFAKQNDGRGLGRTFVLLDGDEVVGYYTLSSSHIEFEHLPASLSKRLPRYPAPAVRIARLAVAKNRQKQGIGSLLLKYALKRVLLASVNMGIAFIFADAKESAQGFYVHYGFTPLKEGSSRFALPISVLLNSIVE